MCTAEGRLHAVDWQMRIFASYVGNQVYERDANLINFEVFTSWYAECLKTGTPH